MPCFQIFQQNNKQTEKSSKEWLMDISVCLFLAFYQSQALCSDFFDLFHDNMPVENPSLRKRGTFQKSNSQLPGDPLPVSGAAPPHGKNEGRELMKGKALKQRVNMRRGSLINSALCGPH